MTDDTDLDDFPVDDAQYAPPAPAEESAIPVDQPSKSKSKSKSKSAKAKGDKGKGGKGKSGKGKGSGGVSVATHPRAHAQVRRAKGWGGLGGFAIAAWLSYRAGVPPTQIGIRALAAGAVGYLVAWGVAVTIWRYLLLAELRAYYEQRKKEEPPGIPLAAGGGPKEDESPA